MISNTFTVSLGKTERTFTGGDTFTAEVFQHLAEHGLKQKLGDAFSTFKGDDDAKLAQASKVWDALIAGTMRATRDGVTRDPVAAEQFKLCFAQVKASPNWAEIAKGLDKKDANKLAGDYAKKLVARGDNRAMAEANVNAAKALAPVDLTAL